MAITASSVNRIMTIGDSDKTIVVACDSLMDTTVIGTTFEFRRLTSSGVIAYSLSGTAQECQGIQAAMTATTIAINSEAGYVDWAYP